MTVKYRIEMIPLLGRRGGAADRGAGVVEKVVGNE